MNYELLKRKLVKDDFIQDCLLSVDSSLVHHSKIQKTKTSIQLPKEHSVDEIITFIGHNLQNEQAIEEATHILKRLTEHEPMNIASHAHQHLFITLMNNFGNDVNIISNVLSIVEKALELFVNEFLRKHKNENRLHISLSSKFLEKIFYIFLVRLKKHYQKLNCIYLFKNLFKEIWRFKRHDN